jgi:DNA-binding SARP family transcriptional activator
VRVSVLGPLEVESDVGVVQFAAAKERSLFAVLALNVGSVMSAERLIDALWGDAPPPTARKTLQTYVSNIRKTVGSDVVTTEPTGYVLRVAADDVDVARFRRLVREGEKLLSDGSARDARLKLGEAVALWRGEPLAGVGANSGLAAERVSLYEEYLSALETRVAADLAAGYEGELVSELEALVRQHPFRERLWGYLMVALYRTGRQADALAAYQRAREMLRDELGLEPGAELQRLERALLAQDPSLDAPPPGGALFEATVTNVVPLPTRLGVRPATGVVGRDDELATILDALTRVTAGEGREVVLVSGEAGLGKSTLVAEIARAASDAGACVLFGHCEEDLATPYQLFSEALGHYVIHAPEDQLLAHVATHGSELARLVSTLARRLPRLPPSKATDADSERYLLFAAAVGLVIAASEHQPVVLVLDDLQWADKASLQLLRHLIAAEQTMRVLVLGTYRDNELSRAHPFVETLAGLHRLHGMTRLELEGLNETGVMALMEATVGHRLDADGVDLAHALYRETDGNPFFLSEVLIHLAETGAISVDSTGRWGGATTLAETALPDSVREVIGARVGRLGSDAERVLSIAAVIGRDFDLDLLARATTTSEDDLLEILDDAASAALVRELGDAPGRYSFGHALIQHTLYQDLGPTRRARVHRVIAEAMEDLCGDHPGARVAELARHWFNARQPIDLSKAISYSRQAGDAALASLAPGDAVSHYRQALDLHAQTDDTDPILGLDLAIGLGAAQRQTGDPAFRETLLSAARHAADLGDTERLVAAALANNRGWFSALAAIDADKVEILEMALARLPAQHPDRARVLATLCAELTYGSPLERREALADEAIAIAQSTGDDVTIVRVLNDVAFPLMVPPLLEESLARTADALVRAEQIGDPVLLFFAASWRGHAASRAGDIAELDRCIEITASLVEQLDQPFLNWGHTFTRAWRAQIAGNIEQAEQLAAEALRLGTDSGQPDASVFFATQHVMMNFQRGTMWEVVPLVEQAVVDNPVVPAYAGLAAMAHAEGDGAAACRLLEEFATAAFDLPVNVSWHTGMVGYAEAAIECRDTRYAAPLFDRLAPWADQMSCTRITAEGPVSHYLGGLATVLGRYDEADAYFARAAAFNDRANAKFFAARTNLSWAKMLTERRAQGDIEKARDLLINARTAAAAYGYANVERRADAALQHLDSLTK